MAARADGPARARSSCGNQSQRHETVVVPAPDESMQVVTAAARGGSAVPYVPSG